MKEIRNTVGICVLMMLCVSACRKQEHNMAVQTCHEYYGWVDSSLQHPKNATYRKLIDDLTALGLPGISLMVQDQMGTWYGSSGYADLGNKTRMQTCHVSKVASVTKLFTAVLIYKLVEQGKLELDDPVSKFIAPDIIKKLKNAEQARVRDLLDHSSGIYDVVFDPEFILYTFNNLDKEKSYEKLLRFAYGKDPDFAYHSKRDYNQTLNHVLLAMIVNAVTERDQWYMIRSEIFQPLQMQHSYLRPQDNIPWERTARGYYDYRRRGDLQDLSALYTGDGRGFTGIYSTVNDLRLFTNALFRNNILISSDMRNEMMEIPSFDTTLACAGGCRAMQIIVDGNTYTWYGHPGGEVNYAAGAFYCLEKNATVTYTANYGVAFTEMGAYTDAYFAFRKRLFEAVSE